LATYHRHARNARLSHPAPEGKLPALPPIGPGTQPEWLGKKVLDAIGIPVPAGALATSRNDAVVIAEQVGYPVVMKVQAAALPHKSEVGGVLLSLRNADDVRGAWDRLHANVANALPDLRLDGVLVEAMGAGGVELVVGATRDPDWGPVVMMGLGGIWVEALKDVRLLSPDATLEEIVAELGKLKAAGLLQGFRGKPLADVDAVAAVVRLVGRLMLTDPDIMEIDINPLVALPMGQGVMALDALFVGR
jgi:acetate---CoA ligase (ADP-forming)